MFLTDEKGRYGGSFLFMIFNWQRTTAALCLIGSTTVATLHHFELLGAGLAFPTFPLAVVGGALGIFVSFRTNSSYDRWWEGRKLWGRMINSSRHFSSQVIGYVGGKTANAKTASQNSLVRRHIAYVHTLRCLLRKQDPLADNAVLEFLTEDEVQKLRSESNQTHALLQWQMDELVALNKDGHLDNFRLQSLDSTILDLLNIQGGCERIKGTPLPQGYGFIAEMLIRYYSVLLPFAMIAELGILTIPMNVLVCLAFGLISEVGRVLEDPFNMFWNALPLSNLSKKIENNLRNRLGEYDLTPIPGPDHMGVLM